MTYYAGNFNHDGNGTYLYEIEGDSVVVIKPDGTKRVVDSRIYANHLRLSCEEITQSEVVLWKFET